MKELIKSIPVEFKVYLETARTMHVGPLQSVGLEDIVKLRTTLNLSLFVYHLLLTSLECLVVDLLRTTETFGPLVIYQAMDRLTFAHKFIEKLSRWPIAVR